MTQMIALSSSLLLSEQFATPAARPAEEVAADCVTGLNEMGFLSFTMPDREIQDLDRVVACKADEQGAAYYRIIRVQEDTPPTGWHVQAIIYAQTLIA